MHAEAIGRDPLGITPSGSEGGEVGVWSCHTSGSADPMGSSGAGMALLSCHKLRQGSMDQSLDVVCPQPMDIAGRGTQLQGLSWGISAPVLKGDLSGAP